MWDVWGPTRRRQYTELNYYTGGSLAPKYDKTPSPVTDDVFTPACWMRSGVPRVWPYASAAVFVAVLSSPVAHLLPEWTLPFPFSAFVSILGFMLVFRTNIAYQRYWEARTMLEEFESKLTDVLIHSLALDRSNRAVYDLQKRKLPQAAMKALEIGHQRFKNVIVHLLSLLHATAFCTLRDDYDLFNLTVHFSGTPLWVTDANGNPLHPDQIEARGRNRQQKTDLKSRSAPGSLSASKSKRKSPEEDTKAAKRPNCPGKPLNDAMTPLLAPCDRMTQTHWARIVSFVDRASLYIKDNPIHRKIDKELEKADINAEFTRQKEIPGSTLQVRRHWSFWAGLRPEATGGRGSDRRWMHKESRLPVIGGLSAAEAIALGAPATDQRPWLDGSFLELRKRFDSGINEQSRCIPWLADIGSTCTPLDGDYDYEAGVTFADEVRHLPVARERAQLIHAWLVDAIMERLFLENGDIARFESTRNGILQCLSSAMLAYQNCRKLSTHQLPWGWYQACHLGLWLFTLVLPFVTTVFMKHFVFSIAASAIVVCFFATLHEVANYIEEPFRFYPNLIPLQLKQVVFNERLLAIMDARRPMGPSDVLKNVTNPVPFQACRWLSQKGKASLINLWCKNLNKPKKDKDGKILLNFTQGVHPSRAKPEQYDPARPYPLPRHQLCEGDKVSIRHDIGTGGFHEEILEERVAEGVVTAVDTCSITVSVDEPIKGTSWKTLFWLGRTEVKSQDRCWGCSDPDTTKEEELHECKRENDTEVLKDGETRDQKDEFMKTSFCQRDIDCIRYLKMHQLDDKDLPDHHVLMLYRNMDISRCRLCTSIYDTLETRNQHWLENNLFDPLVHEFKCGLTKRGDDGPSSKEHSSSAPTQDPCKRSCGREAQHRLALAEREIKQLRCQYAPSPFYARASRHLDPQHDAYCKGKPHCQHLDQRLEHMWEKVAVTAQQSAPQIEEDNRLHGCCSHSTSGTYVHTANCNNLEGEYVDGQFREGRFNVAANFYEKDPSQAIREYRCHTSNIPRPQFQTFKQNRTCGTVPLSLEVRGNWKLGKSPVLKSKFALTVEEQFQTAVLRNNSEQGTQPAKQSQQKQRVQRAQRARHQVRHRDIAPEEFPLQVPRKSASSPVALHASMHDRRAAAITFEAQSIPQRRNSSTCLFMNPIYGDPDDF